MHRKRQHTFGRLPVTVVHVYLAILAPCLAGVDWGGGSAVFRDHENAVMTDQTGLAVLVAAPPGMLIDFHKFLPADSADLINPGRTLTGSSGAVTTVLAVTTNFVSGLLLNSVVPNVTSETMEAMGVGAGQHLYVQVWAVDTFINGQPEVGSRYIIYQAFVDGATTAPAVTFGMEPPNLPTSVMGAADVPERVTDEFLANGDVDLFPVIVDADPDHVLGGETTVSSTVENSGVAAIAVSFDIDIILSNDITFFPWDMNPADGVVSPTDAIFVINRLAMQVPPAARTADINGDSLGTPTDAIMAINRLGRHINQDVFEVAE